MLHKSLLVGFLLSWAAIAWNPFASQASLKEKSLDAAHAGKKETAKSRFSRWVLDAVGDVGAGLLGFVEGVLDWLDEIPFIGDRLSDAIELAAGANVLEAFGAEDDILLDLLFSRTLVDSVALTWRNISDPTVDSSERFEKAFAWPHQAFPGVSTKGYDPTHIDDDVMFLLPNKDMNKLFETDSLLEAATNVWQLQDGGLPVSPEHQGVWDWVKSTHNTKHFLETQTKMHDRFKFSKEVMSPGSAWRRELYHWDDDLFTDVEFSQLYMAGIGQILVRETCPPDAEKTCDARAESARYVAPLDYLMEFEVKDGAGKYGGDVYFAEDGTVTHVYYEGVRYDPQSEGWDLVKRHCRGSLVMWITLIPHLLGVHLHFSNSLAWAVPRLSPTHPLRALLWPHIFNANGVNRKAAATLSIGGGLFARGWALTVPAITALYEYERANNPLFKKLTPKASLFTLPKGPMGNKLAFQQDGLDFYNVLEEYFSTYVAEHYASDVAVYEDNDVQRFVSVLNEHAINNEANWIVTSRQSLVDVLATYVFFVTGYHTHVGSIHHEAMKPGIGPSMWYADLSLDQKGGSPPNSYAWKYITFLQTAALRHPITGDACSTELKCGFADKIDYQVPLPDNAVSQRPIQPVGYPNFFPDQKSKDINKKFVENLIALQGVIIKRNKNRFYCGDDLPKSLCRVFNAFDVNYVELSVAI